jgi:hypothetical protein
MGGLPYKYVVAYQQDAQAALDALRADVFTRGDYHRAATRPRTIREALKRSADTGTRSILDIERISQAPDYSRAAPLTPAELARYFGTAMPSVKMVEDSEDLWQDLERGKARYVVAYEEGVARYLVFIGYSFD